MSPNYKADEKALKHIIKRNVTPVKAEDKLKVIIYYKTRLASNLVMKNNEHEHGKLKATNVTYAFKCTYGDCEPRPDAVYIGHTTTSLSRRLTCHLQSGAPFSTWKMHTTVGSHALTSPIILPFWLMRTTVENSKLLKLS